MKQILKDVLRLDEFDRTMKKGGKVESKLMKKEGRGMAKATMQKVASKVVRGHEKRMHKMKSGGTVSSASKRADGIVVKKARLVGGWCNHGK
jgi:hypothetical protein